MKFAPRDSALYRSVHGSEAELTATDYLLAGIVNHLRTIIWQNGGDNDAAKPELLLLPGMVDPNAPQRLGDSMSIEEFEARWASRKPKPARARRRAATTE